MSAHACLALARDKNRDGTRPWLGAVEILKLYYPTLLFLVRGWRRTVLWSWDVYGWKDGSLSIHTWHDGLKLMHFSWSSFTLCRHHSFSISDRKQPFSLDSVLGDFSAVKSHSIRLSNFNGCRWRGVDGLSRIAAGVNRDSILSSNRKKAFDNHHRNDF